MGAGWTTVDVPVQSERVAVLTGATGGIGCATARELMRAGATVVLAVRDERRGGCRHDPGRRARGATSRKPATLEQVTRRDLETCHCSAPREAQ
jgi:hypothetical protein